MPQVRQRSFELHEHHQPPPSTLPMQLLHQQQPWGKGNGQQQGMIMTSRQWNDGTCHQWVDNNDSTALTRRHRLQAQWIIIQVKWSHDPTGPIQPVTVMLQDVLQSPCRYDVLVSSVLKGHDAVSLRRVGVDGPRRRVSVEGPWCRVVTPHGCRRCRWATTLCRYGASVSKGHGAVLLRRVGVVGVDGPQRCVVTACRCRRATAPCCYTAWVSMGHGATWVLKGHNTTWVLKGHGAVSLRHDAVSVSMGHGTAWVSNCQGAARSEVEPKTVI
ncbi:hypothetical protein EDB85DRAFT_1899165 [Lactarius pseudohatsudake]|nr:hypothetical protein EDB85DRAFT_1899165 [Lactarius pseudohatsudake]